MNAEFERLLGRAVRDAEFRTQLLTDPASATAEFQLTPADRERIMHALAKAEQNDIQAAFQGSTTQGFWL